LISLQFCIFLNSNFFLNSLSWFVCVLFEKRNVFKNISNQTQIWILWKRLWKFVMNWFEQNSVNSQKILLVCVCLYCLYESYGWLMLSHQVYTKLLAKIVRKSDRSVIKCEENHEKSRKMRKISKNIEKNAKNRNRKSKTRKKRWKKLEQTNKKVFDPQLQ